MKNKTTYNLLGKNIKNMADVTFMIFAVILSFYLKLKLVDFIIFIIIVWLLLRPISSKKLLTLSIIGLIFGSVAYEMNRLTISSPIFILSFFFFSFGMATSLKEYLIENKK